MKRVYKIGVFFAVLLVSSSLSFLTAQTVVRILDNTDNSLNIELVGNKKLSIPDQIILVFDSSVVSFKASSAFTSISKFEENSYLSNDLSEPRMLSSLLAEEIEDDMEIEGWMLEPFEVNNTPGFLRPAKEEEIPLEPWMTDLSQWK